MGRTRTKSKRASTRSTKNANLEESKGEPTVAALLEKAQSRLVECDYDLAGRFARRILDREPNNIQGKELLGVVQLETGDLDAAKTVRSSFAVRRDGITNSIADRRLSNRCCLHVQARP